MQEGHVPVFVFPTQVSFYIGDQASHKQVITLYNPYEFGVRFQVLCTSRDKNKYTVVDPEGSIKSHCCVDIVIRHNAVSSQNIGHPDKFRIQMYNFATNKMIGKKDIKAEVLPGEADRVTPDRELFQQLPVQSVSQPPQQYPLAKRHGRQGAPSGLVVGVAIVCVTTLFLPSQGDSSTLLPDYLKPSVNLKLVMAYVLGLVTMVLLRQN